ncbi:MAG: PA3496 family putative envelope integrity protein [Methylobacter sp.]
MAKTSSKSVAKTGTPNNTETEHDDSDIFEDTEYASLSEGIEKETIKRDARRKIEIYWEKKRLKEEFDDFDESEFGF